MNRFFRSALFPLVIIAALVWLALQTLGGHGQKTTNHTTYAFVQQIETQPGSIRSVSIDPNKRKFNVVESTGTKYSVHYASDQREAQIEDAMQKANVTYNSKGTGS